MPGLGAGKTGRITPGNTARVLNRIDPHYIRSRPFSPWPGTPIHDEYEKRQADPPVIQGDAGGAEAADRNAGCDLQGLFRPCRQQAGSMANGRLLFSQSYEGYKFPEEKKRVLGADRRGARRPVKEAALGILFTNVPLSKIDIHKTI